MFEPPPTALNITNLLTEYLPVAAKLNGFKGTPAAGSGVLTTLNYLKDHRPDVLTPEQIRLLGAQLPSILGGYPYWRAAEYFVDGFLMALYLALFVLTTLVFWLDYRNGHFFWPLLLMETFCGFQFVGYLCRLQWTHNLSNISLGLTSIVFTQYPQYLLTHCNLVFAQRLCDWKRPKVFAYRILFAIAYACGIVSFLCTLTGQMMPFHYALSHEHKTAVVTAVRVGAFLEILFTIAPFPFVYIAAYGLYGYLGDQTKKYELPVYQADWISGCSPFYFPRPVHRTINANKHPKVWRVIPTLDLPGDGRSVCLSRSMLPGAPRVLWAHYIILVSSGYLLSAPIIRFMATFDYGSPAGVTQFVTSLDPLRYDYWWYAHSPLPLWEFFGFFPVVVVGAWLVLRVDIRFYLAPIYWRYDKDTTKTGVQAIYETLA